LCLNSISIQGSALTFQSVDNVHGCDCLPHGVLFIYVTASWVIFPKNNVQHITCFLVDKFADTFDTTSPGKTTGGWLGDTLNIFTQLRTAVYYVMTCSQVALPIMPFHLYHVQTC
jgi:hypothetical protein